VPLLGDCGIGKLTRFPLTADFPVRVAGEVAEVDLRPYPFFTAAGNWRIGRRRSLNMPCWWVVAIPCPGILDKADVHIGAGNRAAGVAVTFSSAGRRAGRGTAG